MNLQKIMPITQKMCLAACGAFLLIFLPFHAGMNLCILRDDGGEWYRNVCHFMGTNYIVKVFEVVLLVCVLLHILLAIFVTLQNYLSRGTQRYKIPNKSHTHFMSKYMIWTGGIMACFLVLHFMNFYFVKLGFVQGKYCTKIERVDTAFKQKALLIQSGKASEEQKNTFVKQYQMLNQISSDTTKMDRKLKLSMLSDNPTPNGYLVNLSKTEVTQAFGTDFKYYEPDFYTMAKDLFANKVYSIIYLFVFFVLAFHLFHAVSSIFQTFGLSHPKYNTLVEVISLCYAIVIPIVFGIVPLGVLLGL